MARMIADQNKVGLLVESGTYATESGTSLTWIGYVQSHDINENQGVMSIRYQGTATRNINQHVNGPIDNTGTLSYYPQDFRLLGYALGSMVDSGSPSPYTHVLSETNTNVGNAFTSGTTAPFISFTLEDSHTAAGTGQNLVRTANGCMVDTFTLNGTQGEILTVDVDYIAQNIDYTSGASIAITENTNERVYLWSDVKVHIPSGTVQPELTDFTFTVKNNLEAPHYMNGSRVIGLPFPKNREYQVDLTFQPDSTRLKTLYESYFKAGSEFNMLLEINASTGSQAGYIILSGCKLNPMSSPSPIEGIDETTVTIIPKTCLVNVDDLTLKYNPW